MSDIEEARAVELAFEELYKLEVVNRERTKVLYETPAADVSDLHKPYEVLTSALTPVTSRTGTPKETLSSQFSSSVKLPKQFTNGTPEQRPPIVKLTNSTVSQVETTPILDYEHSSPPLLNKNEVVKEQLVSTNQTVKLAQNQRQQIADKTGGTVALNSSGQALREPQNFDTTSGAEAMIKVSSMAQSSVQSPSDRPLHDTYQTAPVIPRELSSQAIALKQYITKPVDSHSNFSETAMQISRQTSTTMSSEKWYKESPENMERETMKTHIFSTASQKLQLDSLKSLIKEGQRLEDQKAIPKEQQKPVESDTLKEACSEESSVSSESIYEENTIPTSYLRSDRYSLATGETRTFVCRGLTGKLRGKRLDLHYLWAMYWALKKRRKQGGRIGKQLDWRNGGVLYRNILVGKVEASQNS